MRVEPAIRILLEVLVKLGHQGACQPPEGPSRVLQRQKEFIARVLCRDRPAVGDHVEQLLSDGDGDAELLLAP